jgi:hypothetical protein
MIHYRARLHGRYVLNVMVLGGPRMKSNVRI